jgi:AraC family transcriptional regulator
MTMTVTQVSSATSALAWTAQEQTRSEWTTPARGAVATLPWSRLRRVTEYIQEHLDQHLTLAQLAAVAYMSPFHFARLFKGSTGVAPHRFVVRKRIAHATTLLAAPGLSIARISRVVGFRTPSHFSTVFRRFTGSTPSAYRAQHMGGRDERL